MKIRKLFQIFFISLITIVLVLAGLELYYRKQASHIVKQQQDWVRTIFSVDTNFWTLYVNTPSGRRLVPNSHVIIKNHYISKKDIKVDVNSSGLRGKEIKQKDKAIRILVLGDSITIGDYLPEKDTFVYQTEQYINKSFPSTPVEIINGGICDVGIEEEISLLQEIGLPLNPDIVIVAFYMNDSRPTWGFTGEMGSENSWLLRNSFLAKKIYQSLLLKKWIKETGEDRFIWIKEQDKFDWMNNREDFLKFADSAKYDWGAAWQQDSWDIVSDNFAALKSLSEEYNFKVGILIFPVGLQIYTPYLENDPQQKVQELCTAFGFKSLDLLPLLRANNNKRLLYDHCHPVAETNTLISKDFGDFLEKEFLKE